MISETFLKPEPGIGSQKNDKAIFTFPDNLTLVFLVFTFLLADWLEVWFSKPLAMGLGFFIGIMCLMPFAKRYRVSRVHVMSRALIGGGFGLACGLAQILWKR